VQEHRKGGNMRKKVMPAREVMLAQKVRLARVMQTFVDIAGRALLGLGVMGSCDVIRLYVAVNVTLKQKGFESPSMHGVRIRATVFGSEPSEQDTTTNKKNTKPWIPPDSAGYPIRCLVNKQQCLR
jgi:hypothetical protein